jgi:endonuclease/exonuclease/phosphatase (EEP) superfamily protein YafD
LVKDDIPSIFTRITLPSGSIIDFYGVHPEPPKPGTDTYERDTELLIIGKKIRETKNPTIVAGDLNDVGWSVTSKLFRKYSGWSTLVKAGDYTIPIMFLCLCFGIRWIIFSTPGNLDY